MNKLYILNDLHFGVRNSNPIFLNEVKRVFTTLVENLEHGDEIAILGDVFDNRNAIPITAMNVADECFDMVSDYPITIIPGNHDIHYVNRLKPNSLDPLLGHRPNIEILYEPETRSYGENQILWVPWVCPNVTESWMNKIKKSAANICFGHFDIQGFYFNRTTKNTSGYESKIFSKFDNVYSGHYHISSSDKNITYLGTQYQMTWEDHNELKYIHVLDDKGNMNKIQSGRSVFLRMDIEDIAEDSVVKDCYVKIIAESTVSQKEIKDTTQLLLKLGAFEVKIIQNFSTDTDIDEEEMNSLLGSNKSIKEVVSETARKLDLDEAFDEVKIHGLVDDIVSEAYELLNEV